MTEQNEVKVVRLRKTRNNTRYAVEWTTYFGPELNYYSKPNKRCRRYFDNLGKALKYINKFPYHWDAYQCFVERESEDAVIDHDFPETLEKFSELEENE